MHGYFRITQPVCIPRLVHPYLFHVHRYYMGLTYLGNMRLSFTTVNGIFQTKFYRGIFPIHVPTIDVLSAPLRQSCRVTMVSVLSSNEKSNLHASKPHYSVCILCCNGVLIKGLVNMMWWVVHSLSSFVAPTGVFKF